MSNLYKKTPKLALKNGKMAQKWLKFGVAFFQNSTNRFNTLYDIDNYYKIAD